jgi:hypothetical protein
MKPLQRSSVKRGDNSLTGLQQPRFSLAAYFSSRRFCLLRSLRWQSQANPEVTHELTCERMAFRNQRKPGSQLRASVCVQPTGFPVPYTLMNEVGG